MIPYDTPLSCPRCRAMVLLYRAFEALPGQPLPKRFAMLGITPGVLSARRGEGSAVCPGCSALLFGAVITLADRLIHASLRVADGPPHFEWNDPLPFSVFPVPSFSRLIRAHRDN